MHTKQAIREPRSKRITTNATPTHTLQRKEAHESSSIKRTPLLQTEKEKRRKKKRESKGDERERDIEIFLPITSRGVAGIPDHTGQSIGNKTIKVRPKSKLLTIDGQERATTE